ncbi:MAG: aryl-sulfate sulfotransferase [Bacteroidetes bacterium]|nr:aryl-sulfate sulfotransferase [Bacteroidota bacterium]
MIKRLFSFFALICCITSVHYAQDCVEPVYTWPMAGSTHINVKSNIILKYGDYAIPSNIDADDFKIEGNLSGQMELEIIKVSDSKTLLLEPIFDFQPCDKINVRIKCFNQSGEDYEFDFTTSCDPVNLNSKNPGKEVAQKALTLPPDFPEIGIELYGQTAEGDIFLTTAGSMGTFFNVIIDNTGDVKYFDATKNFDFKVIDGDKLISFDQSNQVRKFIMLDTNYAQIDSFQCGNGYMTDFHDIDILPNGNALVICDDKRTIDMSAIVPGGDSMASVSGGIIQEIDKTTKNVVFQWSSFDHFNFTDNIHDADLTASNITYVHLNSVQLTDDGNILISSRRMDEVTKIDRNTGQIIWRLGGKNNDFTFVNETDTFCNQHHAREIDNGNITIFDNANFKAHPPRAVEYQIDETALTATKVWEQYHDIIKKADVMGSIQRLDNGNSLICWGTVEKNEANVTEYALDGTRLFELFIDSTYGIIKSYRAYRFKWPDIKTNIRKINPDPFELTVSPNPFNSVLGISLNMQEKEWINITISTIDGRMQEVVYNGVANKGMQNFDFDGHHLSSGIYLCTVRLNNRTYFKKLIKQ